MSHPPRISPAYTPSPSSFEFGGWDLIDKYVKKVDNDLYEVTLVDKNMVVTGPPSPGCSYCGRSPHQPDDRCSTGIKPDPPPVPAPKRKNVIKFPKISIDWTPNHPTMNGPNPRPRKGPSRLESDDKGNWKIVYACKGPACKNESDAPYCCFDCEDWARLLKTY